MKEAKPASSSSAPDSATPAQPAKVSPGMAALLRRDQGTPAAETAPDAKPLEPKPRARLPLLKPSLVLADLLLVALAACLAWRKGSFGLVEIGLCFLALGLGAWLACLALWFDKDEGPKQ